MILKFIATCFIVHYFARLNERINKKCIMSIIEFSHIFQLILSANDLFKECEFFNSLFKTARSK